MDFAVRYSREHEAFRSEVRTFLDAEVPAALRHTFDYYGEPYETYQLRRRLGRALGTRGWLYPMAPIEYGGGGLDLDSALVIIEELERFELPLPPYYDSGGALGNVAIRVWGTEQQKQTILPPIYRGEQCAWQLLTEPGAGSDLAAVSTQAVRDGDDYVISGDKVFIGNTHHPEAMWTIVRTGPAGDRHKNLSWFWIDTASPGITITPLSLIGGDDKQAIHFDAVRVPADRLVGGENNGWAVASTHLELEHGMRADHMLGSRLQRLWNAAREQFVGAAHVDLEARAAAADLLVQAYVRNEAVRLLGLRNFWSVTNNRDLGHQGSQAYYLEKVTTQWFAKALLDILGPAALVERDSSKSATLIANAQAGSINVMHGGGTAEIQKMIIARRLGLGRERAERSAKLA